MTDRIEPAECQGFSAYYPGGTPHLICPYQIGSRERDKWIEGWYMAAEAYLHRQAAARIATSSPVEAAMRKLRMAGPGTEMAYAVKELIEAMLEGRS
jgi:ribosome modulation factor